MMTLRVAQDKKKELEENITTMIDDFMIETGLVVSEVRYKLFEVKFIGGRRLEPVCCQVSLEVIL